MLTRRADRPLKIHLTTAPAAGVPWVDVPREQTACGIPSNAPGRTSDADTRYRAHDDPARVTCGSCRRTIARRRRFAPAWGPRSW